MTTKNSIRVIKRGERNRREQQVAAEKGASAKTTQETARDMVATVSEWVNELQHRRHHMDTSRAIKTLFSDNVPQPNEA